MQRNPAPERDKWTFYEAIKAIISAFVFKSRFVLLEDFPRK
jgi:hypothetical protein